MKKRSGAAGPKARGHNDRLQVREDKDVRVHGAFGVRTEEAPPVPRVEQPPTPAHRRYTAYVGRTVAAETDGFREVWAVSEDDAWAKLKRKHPTDRVVFLYVERDGCVWSVFSDDEETACR